MYPWRTICPPWNFCFTLNRWWCWISGYVTRRCGCCCWHCENIFQLLQNFHFSITLCKIYLKIFIYILERHHHRIFWCQRGLSELFVFEKHCVTNRILLRFLGLIFLWSMEVTMYQPWTLCKLHDEHWSGLLCNSTAHPNFANGWRL